MNLLSTLVRLPIGAAYGIGLIIMFVCAIPFALVGFVVGFMKWTYGAGENMCDRLFVYLRD